MTHSPHLYEGELPSDGAALRAHRDRAAVLRLYAERDRYREALERIVADVDGAHDDFKQAAVLARALAAEALER